LSPAAAIIFWLLLPESFAPLLLDLGNVIHELFPPRVELIDCNLALLNPLAGIDDALAEICQNCVVHFLVTGSARPIVLLFTSSFHVPKIELSTF
jgi:hypothetical protein